MEAPATETEAAALVRDAFEAGEPLALVGGGTRSGLGRPVQAARTLSTRGLSGITAYNPQEMVMTARAGTPMNEIEAALEENRQRLIFEPIDHRALLETDGEPTIGGVAAVNASGPRRFQAGAARDSLLGLRFVNGRGETIAGGGRVMKNVTGLDLPKVMAGSFGTLGLITQVTFKVTPVPETEATLVWRGLSDAEGIALLAKALATSAEPSGAAHLPARIDGDEARTILRLEGFAPSIAERAARLGLGEPERLDAGASAALWRRVRDVEPLAGRAHVWRISVAPSQGPAVAKALGGEAIYDWQGGLVWLASDAGHEEVRAAIAKVGGHATLVRAPETLRAAVPVFPPQPESVEALERRLREAFDPKGILNPGLMG